MKQLAVDWDELMPAFDRSPMEGSYYLDTDTGQVLLITDKARRQLEQLYDEHRDPDAPRSSTLRLPWLRAGGLPDWKKEQVLQAEFVEAHFGKRVIAIPHVPSYEEYNDMQDFIGMIEDEGLYHQLDEATHGRGAFRRFKDILWQHPAEQDRWYAFRDDRLRERILEWLADNEIEPREVPPPAAADEGDEYE